MHALPIATLLLGLAGSMPLAAVAIGQVDSFQDLTTQGWFAGGGPFGAVPAIPPTTIANGGPGGIGDAFLQITGIGGGGPGSRLLAMNAAQWAGSYLGVPGIAMSLKNFGATDLVIRVLLENPIPGPPTDEIVSNAFINLPAGAGWINGFIPFSSGFTVVEGTVEGALARTTIMRLIHAPVAGLPVPAAGVLGVDNITATPEPGTWLMVGLAGAALLARKLRASRAAVFRGAGLRTCAGRPAPGTSTAHRR